MRCASYKENGKLQALVVTGCLSERYASELFTELPEIDGALGISSWDRIADVVREALGHEKPRLYFGKERLPKGQ